MRGWTDLPKETKEEVIKKLDFMSRCSMRSTCHLNREIVNSTPFFVPRVRFSMNEDKCMIMVYTGIDKFLRIEMINDGLGTNVYRMQNTYSREEGVLKHFPTIQPHPLAYKLISDNFSGDTVLLGALEIDFGDSVIPIQHEKMILLIRALRGKKIRMKKLVTTCRTKSMTDMVIMMNICDPKVLEVIVNDGIMIHNESLTPKQLMDCTLLHDDQKPQFTEVPCQNIIKVPYVESHICMAYYPGPIASQMINARNRENDGFCTVRFAPEEAQFWDYQHFPAEKLNDEVQVKRAAVGGQVHRFNKSKCGVWVHVMREEEEHKFLNFFKNETCGLRYLCPTCTSPFEYWYYQNIARRVYHEPDWALALLLEGDQTVMDMKTKEGIKKMRLNYKRDELKKKKKLDEQKDWGFKKMSNKDKKKFRQPPVVFNHPTDYDDLTEYEKKSMLLSANFDTKTFILHKSEFIVNKEAHRHFLEQELLTGSSRYTPPKPQASPTRPAPSPSKPSAEPGIISKVVEKLANLSPFGGKTEEPKPTKRIKYRCSVEEFHRRMRTKTLFKHDYKIWRCEIVDDGNGGMEAEYCEANGYASDDSDDE